MAWASDQEMAQKEPDGLAAQATAREALQALGRGFDVTLDLRLAYCKGPSGSCLIELDEEANSDIVIPGGATIIPNVSRDIKCDKGERTHFRSEVLQFHEMSERFNQTLSISGKVPLGLFNTMFSFNGTWQSDASATKALALEGWFVSLYTVQICRTPQSLKEEVRKAVPPLWEPAALASFIEKYGTHIIMSVKIGGKDVVYIRQYQSSPLSAGEIKKYLKEIADQRFVEGSAKDMLDLLSKQKSPEPLTSTSHAHRLQIANTNTSASFTAKGDVEVIFRRRGGDCMVKHHSAWLATVPYSPDVIAMSFMPITSLLNGVPGSGFLSHAINLYLRYKPPIEELQFFLEFQIPRQWSPAFDLPLGPQRKEPVCPSLQFSLMGPKLYVSTTQVMVGRRPVTGLRLNLEGKKGNRLAIHLQHLTNLPKILQPHWDQHIPIGPPVWKEPEEQDSKWFEPVLWKSFSHVSTAPVEYIKESYIGENSAVYIVTGAQLQVWDFGLKNVLFLRLLFLKVPGCSVKRTIWDHAPQASQKSGLFSQLGFSSSFTSARKAKSSPVVMNSAVFPEGPPAPEKNLKLLKFVDVKEMTKGAQDMPGHWLVTGAKLDVDKGKVALRLKYSLLHYEIPGKA